MTRRFAPYELEILWSRLLSIAEEQAQVLMRTAFSTIVREAGDLSAAIFDRSGRMIAQARTGTPGHVNTMALGMRHFLEAFLEDLAAVGGQADAADVDHVAAAREQRDDATAMEDGGDERGVVQLSR